MESETLKRLFRDNVNDMADDEIQKAILDIRLAALEVATEINKSLIESQSKNEILGRLFRIVVDAELAIRMDGISRTQSPIVMTRQ